MEVGYYGRGVRHGATVGNAIGIVRAEEREKIAEEAEKRLLGVLVDKLNATIATFQNSSAAGTRGRRCIDAEIVGLQRPLETAEQVEQTTNQSFF